MPTFSHGARVLVRYTDGLVTAQWREGIIIDLFVAPVSGEWVYVVGGNGYYEADIRSLSDNRLLTDIDAA